MDTDLSNAPKDSLKSNCCGWCAWCNGAAGIALALKQHTHKSENQQLILDAAIDTMVNWTTSNDSVCCGTAGIVAIWQEVMEGTTGLMDYAYKFARRGTTKRFEVATNKMDFWNGFSGIGYTFLRLANPSLPNVLLFE